MCQPLHPRCLSPPYLSHLIASAHVLSSKNKGEISAPSSQDSPDGAWATSIKKKRGDFLIYQGPLRGAPCCVFNTPSGKRENPPSRPRLPGVVETDEGVFTSLRWRGGSRRDGDRGRSGRVSLGSELWLGYERRSRSGVQWAGLRGVRAALGGSLSPASARWTAPAPLRVYKGERAGSRGLSPPH